MAVEPACNVVLVGLESVGKSAIFRGLTRARAVDEANFRGSTVRCRRCPLPACDCTLVDTPGIRIGSDSTAMRLALDATSDADVVVLVVRGSDVERELATLVNQVELRPRRMAVAMTFADRSAPGIERAAADLSEQWKVPVVSLDARRMSSEERSSVIEAIRTAREPASLGPLRARVRLPVMLPRPGIFEHRTLGEPLALLSLVALLCLPVYAAFRMAALVQPLFERVWLGSAVHDLAAGSPTLSAILVGPYGLLTLGVYSFIWAFPVVLFVGVSSSLAEESGLHDRVTSALDPWMRHVGLAGRDLLPVLTGFGCNVVAVLQTRPCSACSRRSCVSLIGYGSACSYQIGATLSLFGAAGHPSLFAPYLVVVFIVGLIHTRAWHGALSRQASHRLHERAFFQWPSLRAVSWKVTNVIRQFALQAMPIFLGLCLASALLERCGLLAIAARAIGPAMRVFNLPEDVAGAVLASAVRKDGMLLLNARTSAGDAGLSAAQMFVAVYLASTLTPCLVTLWTVRRELGWRVMGSLVGRQALTSLLSAWLVAAGLEIGSCLDQRLMLAR